MDLELSVVEAIAIVAATAALAVVGRALPMRSALPIAAITAVVVSIIVGDLLGVVVVVAALGLGLLAGAVIRGSVEAREGRTPAVGGPTTPSGPPSVPPRGDWQNPDDLTRREVEVLSLIAAGRSNDEIGAELHISMATVKTHVNHIFTKSGVHDRAQAVTYAYEQGLSSPPPRG